MERLAVLYTYMYIDRQIRIDGPINFKVEKKEYG